LIIVAGYIQTKPGDRDQFVMLSRPAMIAARKAPGCKGFVVTADPLAEDRVHIYEQWDDENALDTFRGEGPGSDLGRLIVRADVRSFSAKA
jgi:quinol monooxygenase YgiN